MAADTLRSTDRRIRSPLVTTDDAPTTTTLVFIRHGESNVTVNRVIGGFRTCSGLSPLGQSQAQRLGERLRDTGELDADVLIASNFERAMETARIIAPALGDLEIEVDATFGEHDPGPDIDGMTFMAYIDKYGTPDWAGDPHLEIFPGGETTAQFHVRVGEAIARIASEHQGQTVVIVCHGGVIDMTFRHLLHAPVTGVFELNTTNTSLTQFRLTDSERWQLVRYNDAAHLDGLPTESPRASHSAD
jgi:probable phosphoglycerate mutase